MWEKQNRELLGTHNLLSHFVHKSIHALDKLYIRSAGGSIAIDAHFDNEVIGYISEMTSVSCSYVQSYYLTMFGRTARYQKYYNEMKKIMKEAF